MKSLFLCILIASFFSENALSNDFDDANKALDSGNVTKAAKLFEKSCLETKDGNACFNAGLSYALKQDHSQANSFYKTACDADNVGACFNLAHAYANGSGIKQDHRQANSLFKKACDGDDSDACVMLGFHTPMATE